MGLQYRSWEHEALVEEGPRKDKTTCTPPPSTFLSEHRAASTIHFNIHIHPEVQVPISEEGTKATAAKESSWEVKISTPERGTSETEGTCQETE